MPVKFFVSQDYQQHENPPEYSHEILAVIEIIKDIYAAFNHHPNLYAIVANLDKKNAYADLVVITERGLGVIEMKGNYGSITQRGHIWFAGNNIPIKAGSERTPAQNPHEQVQAYAQTIRNMLTKNLKWLPCTVAERQAFKLATAVCFSHDQAEIKAFRKAYRHQDYQKAWEKFTLLKPNDIPEWVVALSFETQNPNTHQSYRLTPLQIRQILKDLLGVIEWTEIKNLMPTGEPYAYLRQGNMIFSLVTDEVIIGTNAVTATVAIPKTFAWVSRNHAKIIRQIDKVVLTHIGNTNGTFVNRQQIEQPVSLQPGDVITLGGKFANEKVCELQFFNEPPSQPLVTELGT